MPFGPRYRRRSRSAVHHASTRWRWNFRKSVRNSLLSRRRGGSR